MANFHAVDDLKSKLVAGHNQFWSTTIGYFLWLSLRSVIN